MIRRRASSRFGFTLIELIVVMAIIVVLASMAAPRFGNTLNHRRVEMAAHRIAADMKLARQRARISGATVRMTFNTATDVYTVSGMTSLDHPTQTYRATLADEPYRVDLTSADVGGDNELVFDAYGEVDSAATITVQSGGAVYAVTLARGGVRPEVSRTQ